MIDLFITAWELRNTTPVMFLLVWSMIACMAGSATALFWEHVCLPLYDRRQRALRRARSDRRRGISTHKQILLQAKREANNYGREVRAWEDAARRRGGL